MARFVGVKNNHICIVSDNSFISNDLQTLEVPPELSEVSSSDLITNCRVKDGVIKCKTFKKTAKQMKIALVGNWKMRCGISTYSENLWPQIIKYVGHFKLFIEQNDSPTGDIHQIGTQTIPDDQVSVCWKRGESCQQLIKELKEYNPDVILLQHEFGLWPNAAHWMAMLTQLSDYRIIVFMHSVFPNHKDKTIVEACIPEIVVHLDEAKEALVKKGVSSLIHVIPHGCYEYSSERYWNFYKTDHTIIQMGFGFRYKGFEDTIVACSILKDKYPDLFLTIIFSESSYNAKGHQIYYNELINLIEKLSLQENVAIVRGFQSDKSINSYLRTNKVAVFPYKSNQDHLVYGASGAARLAMSANLPVMSSNIPHFSDLPTIKCISVEEIAKELDKLFSNSEYYENQIKKQNNFMEDNSWANVAIKIINILEN